MHTHYIMFFLLCHYASQYTIQVFAIEFDDFAIELVLFAIQLVALQFN